MAREMLKAGGTFGPHHSDGLAKGRVV